MKGIVADIDKKYIVILSSDGRFVKIRNNGLYAIGSEIDTGRPLLATRADFRLKARTASLAAGILLALGLGYGAYSYTVPYSYVDVDINPSIEITTNIFDRILKVEGLNEDGQKLLQANRMTNSRLDEGIAFVLSNAVKQGYLSAEPSENAIIMTVVSNDTQKSAKLRKNVETAVDTELKSEGIRSDLVVAKASHEERETAKKKGLTPGKLNLIEKAVGSEPELKVEDLKDTPVKDILKQIDETRKNAREDKKDNRTAEKGSNTTEGKAVKQDDGKGLNSADGKSSSAKNGSAADKNSTGGLGAKIVVGDLGKNAGNKDSGQNRSFGPYTGANPAKNAVPDKNTGPAKGSGSGKDTGSNKGPDSNKGSNSNKGSDANKGAGSNKSTGSNKGTGSNNGAGTNKNANQEKKPGSDKGADRNKNSDTGRNTPGGHNNDAGSKGNNSGGRDNNKSGAKDNGKSGDHKKFDLFNFFR